MTKNGKFLMIDGSSLIYRAFFALPLLQTKQGLYTNAVYGFTTMLLRLLAEEKPDFVAVAFDRGAPTFRHEQYAEYKGKREKTPRELTEQITYVCQLLSALKIPIEEADRFEADDLIGTMAKAAGQRGIAPVIVTGDADLFQLVDMPAEVIYTRRGITQVERYTEETLMDRYGLTAKQFIDYKGLKGDTTDNIPGVPGIGEKTAIKLLTQYQSMENIYENLSELKGKLRETLEQHQEQAFLSRDLATIVTDAPLAFEAHNYARQLPDYASLRVLYQQLEFNSLLEKLPADNAEMGETEISEPSQLVDGPEEFRALQSALQAAELVAILPLPAGMSWHGSLAGLSVAMAERTYYIPISGKDDMKAAVSLLTEPKFCTVAYDVKAWINICYQATGCEPTGEMMDVSLAAYLLDPLENGYPPEKLAERYLKRKLPKLPPQKKREESVCGRDYSCAAVRTLYDLYPILKCRLAEVSLDQLYTQLELPLTATLARMERAGIALDLSALAAMKEEFRVRIQVLETEVYSLAGETFNLNSPKQLGHILFEKLGLPALKKTKTGFSTDAQVLEELAPQHEIVEKILQYRTLMKLLTTYLEGLSKLVNHETGRIHTTFNQTVTATGRLSSAEPNLQNIPIRLEEGRRVRRAFVPGEKGNVLLSADYSQIELRILAHLSGDHVLIDSFRNEEDIHRRTASEVFGVPQAEVTPQLRDRAKAVNFGIIYGISDYGLSKQLGISRQEAKLYITRYLERLPGVSQFLQEVVAQARENGYVTTILNRRRYLPDINARNLTLRSFAERTAMNTPIQGAAADIIKLAMLRVEKALIHFDGKAKMMLQVHDDLVFEVREEALLAVAAVVRQEMEGAIELAVPLTVDVKAGSNWAQMKKIHK